MNHRLQCQCGQLRGQVNCTNVAIRGKCYCKDCRTYADHLEKLAQTHDEAGGLEFVATSANHITFDQGVENLACLSLSGRGLLKRSSEVPVTRFTVNTLLAILASSLAAAAVQPVFLFCWLLLPVLLLGQEIPWDQFLTLVFFSTIFALPFILLLGVPLTILLQQFGQLRWRWLAVAGALAGAIFAGMSGPGGGPGYSSGGNWYGNLVSFVVNGEPTIYGWLRYFRSILVFALHGVLGASVFFLVWVRFKPAVKV